MVKIFKILIQGLLIYLLLLDASAAIERPESELKEAGLTPVLGTQVNLDLPFQNSAGATITLRDLLITGGKPLVIIPAYYTCPRLCGLLLAGASQLFSGLDLVLGQDYSIATVSFNKKDNHLAARGQELRFRQRLDKNSSNPDAWHFLVGQESSINELMGSLGFGFKQENEDFAHAAALFILTPDGKISQYFTGIEFPTWDVKLAMVEASRGGIGSVLDHVMLFCFRFDPLKGRYTLVAQNIMRGGGALTLLLLAGMIIRLRYRENARQLNK